MARSGLSVLTLVRGRQRHLDGLLAGLQKQTDADFEVVIASMQPQAPMLPKDLNLPVRVVDVSGTRLPLAAARNAAALEARGELLVFLDVDCVPSPTLVSSYRHYLRATNRCLLGEVRYLPGTIRSRALGDLSFQELQQYALKHPARPDIPTDAWIDEPDCRALWGLSFGISREQYFGVGGMDESFVGYGGEETDFAERLASTGIRFAWCPNAMALHQYHPVSLPPLDKFDDIVENAQRFYDKWQNWCMEYWLMMFSKYKLIDWSITSRKIEVVRWPTSSEIEASYCGPEVAFG